MVFIKDNYKLVQYYFSSITVFQFFPLWDSLVPGTLLLGGGGGIPGPRNPLVENNTPTFIFDIFKIIGIRNCPYILLIYSLVQNSANLFFFFNSDISGLLQCRIETSNGAFFSTLRGPPLIHIGTLCIFRSMCKISSFL